MRGKRSWRETRIVWVEVVFAIPSLLRFFPASSMGVVFFQHNNGLLFDRPTEKRASGRARRRPLSRLFSVP